MRIDYVLASHVLIPRVQKVTVYGHGANRDGFLGSDHCPLIATLGEGSAGGNTEVKRAASAPARAVDGAEAHAPPEEADAVSGDMPPMPPVSKQ